MEQGGKNRRRRRSGRLYATLIVTLMIIAALFGVGIFFKVSEIEVTGLSMYKSEQVIDLSGIEIGDSIFFVQKSSAVISIKSAMPYIDDVRIVRTLPGTVTIEVTESYPIASFSSGGSYWIIDKNAKILEQTTSEGASDTINVTGLQPIMPAVGETLALGDEGALQLEYLRNLLSAILSYDFQDGITNIDISNANDISFDYYSFTVKIGRGENVEDKFWLFSASILKEHDLDEGGTVDLSNEDEARYFPQ